MSKIDTSKWEEFKVGDLFDIHPTKAYKMTNSTLMENDGKYPVVVNSSYNNGIGGYTNQPPTEKGNIITFSDTTSSDAIFYQKGPFVGYPHVQGMYPKKPFENSWDEASFLFFLVIFRTKAINLNYDYVNKFTRDSASEMYVLLPVDENHQPDFSYMESYMKNREIAVSASLTKLQSAKRFSKSKNAEFESWKTYKIKDIFPNIVKPTVYHTREVKEASTGIPYVVRSKFNNGIKYNVERPVENVNPAKVISFGAENATFFYQKSEWISGRDMYYIDTRDISEYACLFITSCLQPIAEKYSYNYGMFPDLLKEENIKLPADINGNPDYVYMEDYMKAVESKVQSVIQCLTAV